MRGLSRDTFNKLAATVRVALPAAPTLIGIMLRGAEGWKLWHQIGGLTPLGIVVLLWICVYAFASVVSIFDLDPGLLKWWELLIDAGNMTSSVLLATQCAANSTLWNEHQYRARFAIWLGICLMVQIQVTFVARRARHISETIYRRLNSRQADANQMDRAEAEKPRLLTPLSPDTMEVDKAPPHHRRQAAEARTEDESKREEEKEGRSIYY